MPKFSKRFKFSKLPIEQLRRKPGLYEVLRGRIRLKVGISGDLGKRLTQHAKSLQRKLKSVHPEPWVDPSHVRSNGSILAKHLYFDKTIAFRDYDLRTEAGRRAFLECECRVRFVTTRDRQDARKLERALEATKIYLYC